MAIEFTRKYQARRELPLTAMIDVVFILIFFFMLTTSFLKIESMELMLPSAGSKAAVQTESTTITLRGDDYVKFGKEVIAADALGQQLSTVLSAQPDHGFLLLIDEQVSMQRLVMVMDLIGIRGGGNVSVRPLGKVKR